MKTMLILATALSFMPFVLAIFMPNWYLGDQQNAVEERDLAGRRSRSASLAVPRLSEDGESMD